jgi:signal transduction histidine kinase/DNA-binding response OmpR family regulator
METDPNVKILLVDDQPGNLLALEAILEALGPQLVKARSGAEALKRLLEDDFALILLDVQMPGMDGLETAALIRQRDKSRHTPIIFLTAYERNDVQMFQGYSLGAVDFLFKPFLPDVLRSKVMVFVELYRKREEVKRQAELLRENQRQEHERHLAEERRRWEMDRLRQEAEKEKNNAALLAQKADELAQTVAKRTRAEAETRERARQQALVAELGQRALAGIELDALMNEAVALVAQTTDVEYCLVLELLPDEDMLQLRAGVGWDEGTAAFSKFRAGNHSQAGYALLHDRPVVVEDLATDRRFDASPLLLAHRVVSGMTVIIRGRERPFGALGAHTRRTKTFTNEDVHFLQAVANVLATAIQRKRDEEKLAGVQDELALQLRDMTRLQELSARLSNTLELQAILEEVLRAVTELQNTDMGVLLLRDRERPGSSTVTSLGLCEDYVQHLRGGPDDPPRPEEQDEVIVADTEADPHFAPYRPAARLAGYRAAHTVPLLTRGGEVLGTVAAFFRQPHRPSSREIRLVQLYTRQAAQALDNAWLYREIQEANRRKDEFLAMLAHELRNPLAPILNAMHILRLGHGNGPALEQTRGMIERQVRNMVRLVDDLLDVSRITRGKIQLRKEIVDLPQAIARAVESTTPLLEARGHQLNVTLPPECLRLEADPTRLEQILANLLSNAAKYTEPGGRIELAAERGGDDVVLRVKDSGIGIAAEMLPHIFDLFMQAEGSLDRSQGGLGIGLTLVRRLVEMHGGRVQAFSDGLGQGSEFVVRLPALKEPSPKMLEPVTRARQAPARPMRVLVVDDNKDAAESLAILLGLEGHQVRICYDGPAALTCGGPWRPEVVLLDIGLPGIDGYEVARRLRAQDGTTGVLLVAITGYGQEEDRRRALEAGFDRHLTKPVDLTELRELLAGCGALT